MQVKYLEQCLALSKCTVTIKLQLVLHIVPFILSSEAFKRRLGTTLKKVSGIRAVQSTALTMKGHSVPEIGPC